MIILHDADSSRYSVEPGCTPLRRDLFERVSLWVARSASGREGFYFAFMLILAWVGVGPYCRFHQSWTTAFSVVTTSVSFLLVFFIRHVQNCESKAVHLKLDELIYAAKNARNELISIEHLTEEQLDHLSRHYLKLAGHYQKSPPAIGRLAPIDLQRPARPHPRRFPTPGIGGQTMRRCGSVFTVKAADFS